MGWTRSEYRTKTAQLMDAVNSPRWDFTDQGEVDRVLSACGEQEWRRLLDVQPYLRTAERAATRDSQGRVTIASLNSGSGDTLEQLHKILAVYTAGTDGAWIYEEQRLIEQPFAVALGAQSYTWHRAGDYLQLLPVSTAGVTVLVNHRPQTLLGMSGSAVVWPFVDGYEELVCYRAASRLLDKGGAESEASDRMQTRADVLWDDLSAWLGRLTLKPILMRLQDDPADWGGQ